MELPPQEYLGWVSEVDLDLGHASLYLYKNSTTDDYQFDIAIEQEEVSVWKNCPLGKDKIVFEEKTKVLFPDTDNVTEDELTLFELETGVELPREVLYTLNRYQKHLETKGE